MPERPCFQIGLTMAGAVSAGAYTAGVIDFLFEALDAIEDVRAKRDTSYLNAGLRGEKSVFDPPHDVQIAAMAGTSAGSMVTAIVATVLGTRIKPVGTQRNARDTTATGNPLYDAWVQEIHYDKLLSTSDLAGGKHVLSLLNSDELDAIVKRTLAFAKSKNYLRPYLAETLPIYLCVSNLRGVRYSLKLDVDADVISEYQMSLHADWMGFSWSKEGLERPGFVSISPGTFAAEWTLLGDAALSSGAFPLGLAARELKRKFANYLDRKWFIPGALLPPQRKIDANGNPVVPPDSENSWVSRAGDYENILPLDQDTAFPNGIYDFLNVDGGIFDNEPLELARRELAGAHGRNPRDGRIADRSVILIDPFPNLFPLDTQYSVGKERDLLNVIKSLVPAMIAQARFKPDELALARDASVASRHAIMPIRYGVNDKPEKYAIACGSLGGFGGFLSKEFRHHDFMLGRRNCQRFLANHFLLPADPGAGVQNKLFAGWDNPKFRQEFQVKGVYVGLDGKKQEIMFLPIIPLLGKLASPDYTKMPAWPARPFDLKVDDLRKGIIDRADALKDSLIAQYQPKFLLGTGLKFYWRLNKTNWINRFAVDKVRTDLETRGIKFN